LSGSERDLILTILPPDLCALFLTMAVPDQRHALDVYLRTGSRPELAQAALLHDIGKVSGPEGAVPRACATVLAVVGLPLKGRWKTYVGHGPIGATILAEHNADDLAVAFARHHPEGPPDGADRERWSVLLRADHV
jgi:response regulator RpfG family c-di-GMP phosphodiesterase